MTPMRDYLVMEVALAPVVADLRQPTASAFTTIAGGRDDRRRRPRGRRR